MVDGDGEGAFPGETLKPKGFHGKRNPRVSGWDGIWCFAFIACNSDKSFFNNFSSIITLLTVFVKSMLKYFQWLPIFHI